MTNKTKLSSCWGWTIALLSAMDLVLCILMTRHALTASPMMGCGVNSSCDTVLSSRWSYIFDFMPVSGLALSVYLVIIVCTLFIFLSEDKELKPLIWKLLLVLSGAILGSAIWFILLQIFAVHAFCPYCMSAHATGMILSVLLIGGYSREQEQSIFSRHGWGVIAGLLLAGLLALTQVLTTTTQTVYDKGYTSEPLPEIHPDEVPLIGQGDAEYVIDLLFDYQCSHCQRLHHLLKEVVEKSHGKVAFALCPSPLSAICNPYIPHDIEDVFDGSCELAKMAFTVWRADQDAFYVFDEWLFESDKVKGWYPRSVSDATQKAIELIGKERLESGLKEEWIQDQFAKFYEIFGRTTNGKGTIPRMVYKNAWNSPSAETADELLQVLSYSFQLSLFPDSQ